MVGLKLEYAKEQLGEMVRQSKFELVHCNTLGIDIVSADSSHSFGKHTHDQFGIGLLTRGAQKSISGRGPIEAEAGDLITVNPGEVHDGRPIGDDGRSWQMLYVDPEIISPLISDLTCGRTDYAEFSRPALHDTQAASTFGALAYALSLAENCLTELEISEQMLELVSRLIEHQASESIVVPKSITMARERIDDDPCSPLTLAELAAIADMSQFQLLRGFSKAVGLTPHAYLIQRRLHEARKMIASGLSLTDSALASGFSDQSHLNRQFVRAYGISPGIYASALK